MAAALPVLKLGVLLVKQMTKPMTRALKARAANGGIISRACEWTGQCVFFPSLGKTL